MKQTLKQIWKSLSRVNGNSLAEFATVSALMATLAATAAPKLSEMAEGGKADKSTNEIDKIMTQAQNFYQTTADTEGRGRFPGQNKFDQQVGGYATENAALAVLGPESYGADGVLGGGDDTDNTTNFDSWNDAIGLQWRSVFGTTNATAPQASGGQVIDDAGATVGDLTSLSGHEDWKALFAGNTLKSPYQDGHFIYVVIPGEGSGRDSQPPILIVADAENPADYNTVLEP